jgi:hypothetical protein
MDLTAIVKELMEERDIIDAAISSLERIAQHRGKRRGRPPAWMSMIADEPKKGKKRGRPRKVAPAGK